MEPQSQEDVNDLIDFIEANGWSVEKFTVDETPYIEMPSGVKSTNTTVQSLDVDLELRREEQ